MSKIQWTDITQNPITVATGGHWCRKISAGCANCYAETINTGARFSFASGLKYSGPAPDLKFDHEMVAKWSRMRSPKRIFVGSMTDVFGDWVPREWQFRIFDAAKYAPMQTIQLLTKRPDVALVAAREWCESVGKDTLPPNVWMGCTMEDQASADARIDALISIPAAVRFISAEPLLSKILLPYKKLEQVQWVIVGGESGPGARPCELFHLKEILGRCINTGTPAFVKQLGSRPTNNGYPILRVRGKGGTPEDLERFRVNIREFPTANTEP